MWLLALIILSDSVRSYDMALAPAETLRVTELGVGAPVRLGTFTIDTVPGAGQFLYEERPDVVVAAVDRVASARFAHESR